jgi:hypothetical protein
MASVCSSPFLSNDWRPCALDQSDRAQTVRAETFRVNRTLMFASNEVTTRFRTRLSVLSRDIASQCVVLEIYSVSYFYRNFPNKRTRLFAKP